MLRDITIGQYYPVKSPIHKLDPRVKLLATLVYVVSIFLVGTFIGYAIAVLALAIVILISGVPFKFIMKGLKIIIVLLIISVSFNVFFTDGSNMLFQYGVIKISVEGIKWAIFMAIRLVLIIVGCSLMTYTTTPNDLTAGMERGLRGLNKIKIPVHEIAMMMSIALRFIPILVNEADKIIKAQSARGADFESGKLISRAKSLIPVIVPLFISSFRRASELATAMESRCYKGGEGRTKYNPLKYDGRDMSCYGILAIFTIAIITVDIVVKNVDALAFFVA